MKNLCRSIAIYLTIICTHYAFAGDHREPEHAQTAVINKSYPKEKAPKLRVVSFNMAAARTAPLSRIAAALQAFDADIIAIQEVDNKTLRSGHINQATELQTLTGLNVEFGRAINFEGGEYGLAIASRHPIDNVTITPLFSGKREARILMSADISVPGFNAPVTVFNTHLDTGENPELRTRQVRQINKHTINNRGIKLLTGDINDVPETDTYRDLLRYWNNTWAYDKDARSWPAINPEIEVDYIFSSKAQRWEVEQGFIPNNDGLWNGIDWRTISDHLPIIMDMKLIEQ